MKTSAIAKGGGGKSGSLRGLLPQVGFTQPAALINTQAAFTELAGKPAFGTAGVLKTGLA